MTSHALLPAEPSRAHHAPRVPEQPPPVPAVDVSRNAPASSPHPHKSCACGGICPRCSQGPELTEQDASRGRGEGESQAVAEPEELPAIEPELDAPEAVPAQSPPTAPPPPPPPAVATLTPNIGSSGSTLAHVPACGAQPAIVFTAGPASAVPVTWSVAAGSAALDAGTTLLSPQPAAGARNPGAATRTATLTLGAGQTGGTLTIAASNAQGAQSMSYPLASHPTGITSTRAIGDPVTTTEYGGVFDHVFTSNDAQVSSLDQVAVGERFPNLPNPTTGTHTFPTPFGSFRLLTGTLPNAASGASGNWFLTNAGELGGSHDNVTILKSMIDIGKHLVSDSNPAPTNPLPAGFDVAQELHWWCPHGAAGSRWTQFAPVTHTRQLRLDSSGTDAEFVAIVNGEENTMPYEGLTGVRNARATPATVEPSPRGGTANTVQISADAFPSTRQLHFSIQGAALGCTIDAATGLLTIGPQTGVVTVRAANVAAGPNWDEIQVTIAAPAAPPTPAPPPTPSPTPPPTPSPPPTPGSTAPSVGGALPPR